MKNLTSLLYLLNL